MKDVKSYLNTVSSRITKAFSIDDFGVEEELEFWSLSAEHMSRKSIPSFSDIVKWMDLLYNAPVHIVYKKDPEEEQLVLFKRQIITHNFIRNGNEKDKSDNKDRFIAITEQERIKIDEFEQTIQNLQHKKKWYPEYLEYGVSSHSIGSCEHIPIYNDDGDIWGIYVVGPQTKCPESLVPKLSIVGRLLSIWLIEIEKLENESTSEYQEKMGGIVSELGSGALNIDALSGFYIRFAINKCKAESGAFCILSDQEVKVRSSINLSDDQVNAIQSNEIVTSYNDKVITGENKNLGQFIAFPFQLKDVNGFLLILKPLKADNNDIISLISTQMGALFEFESDNKSFTQKLIDSYYMMLRSLEMEREQTKFHTPRILAFIQRFALIFGLDDTETEIITKSARLHDIGYVGGLSVDGDQSISKELSHPLTGYKLIDQLPLHQHVKEGVLMHQEWVNGQGTPFGLNGDEIVWTGKILSIFEYVVEFIESNIGNETQDGDELLEILTKSIIERADKQFDMVLVPTVVQLLQSIGWENCCTIGTE